MKIISEIGSVHDGSFGNALNLIKVSKDCGVDIVKFQMHIPEFETTRNAPNPKYFREENRWEYFKRTSFTIGQWKEIINFTKKNKLKFMCSVFSIESAKILINDLNVKYIKVPSGEVNNLPLIEYLNSG